jgi:predicted TIM-barrel fold metal-dependent hydrolase
MDIVDTQVHANRTGPHWETAEPAETINLTLAGMDAVGVDATLVVELGAVNFLSDPDPCAVRLPNGAWRYSHDFSELAVKMYPDRFGYVTRIDPLDPEAPDILADLRKKPGNLATRISPLLHPELTSVFMSGGCDPFFAAAQKHSVPVFLFMSNQPDALIPYAKKFPDLQLITDHWGFPMPRPNSERGMSYFKEKVLALAAYPNICLKWSKAPRFVSSEPYPHKDVGSYIRASLDAFGAERIMWASDTTVSKGITTWAEEVYHIMDSDALDQSEKEQIFGRTARRVLRWPKPT